MTHTSVRVSVCLLLICCALPLMAQRAASADGVVPAMVKFTGTLNDINGKPLTGTVGVTFFLYKDQNGLAPLWMETQNVQADKNGHYSVMLGSGTSHGLPTEAFTAGEARWLGVQPSDQAEQPRVVLVSVPYALKALDAETLGGRPVSAFMVAPPSGSAGSKGSQQGSLAEQANEIVCLSGTACKTGFVPLFSSNGGSAKVNDSIIRQSAGAISVAGSETVTSSASRPALSGQSSGTNAVSDGVDGVTSSGTASGVAGINNGNGIGVYGTGGTGVFGTGGYGVWGEVSSPGIDGVHGVAHTQFSGVAGLNDGSGFGVFGEAFGSAIDGVHGVSNNAAGSGVAGVNFAGGDGVFGGTSNGGFAGYFGGDVHVTGNLSKGGGSFKIDHPLDPANKYLYHSFVESPDMMNLYNGNVTTDAQGNARVQMPEWFDALNRDFRYQLTVIGQFAQAIVATKMENRSFSIKTDKPNVEVSWQVTGIRQDAWANAHRIPVEQWKPQGERGLYLHPELFGAPAEKGITAHRHPGMQKQLAKERKLQQQSSANH